MFLMIKFLLYLIYFICEILGHSGRGACHLLTESVVLPWDVVRIPLYTEVELMN